MRINYRYGANIEGPERVSFRCPPHIQTGLLPNAMIEVRVTDNGPGIDATMADQIFGQFQTSKETGMGIGLSLCRTLIEVHGGKLWVEKNHQNGALFGFKLPVSE